KRPAGPFSVHVETMVRGDLCGVPVVGQFAVFGIAGATEPLWTLHALSVGLDVYQSADSDQRGGNSDAGFYSRRTGQPVCRSLLLSSAPQNALSGSGDAVARLFVVGILSRELSVHAAEGI